MKRQLEVALDALLELRSEIMRVAPDDVELRSSLRCVICKIDELIQRGKMPDRSYENVIRWLSMFLDVEHGTALKTLADSSDEALASSLDQYVRARSGELAQAESLRPAAISAMRHGCGLLGKKVAEADHDDRLPRAFSRLLETHLEDDACLRRDLNDLISAMQDLLTEVTQTIQGLGLPFTHKSCHSESSGGHMQGALPAAMVVPLQGSATQQMAAGWLARREPLHTDHTCVAALANGITMLCAPRLGLTRVQGFCGMICG